MDGITPWFEPKAEHRYPPLVPVSRRSLRPEARARGGLFCVRRVAVSARRIHLKLAYIAVARSPQRHSPFFPSLPAGHDDHECRAALGGLSLFHWCDSCRRARARFTLSTSTRTRTRIHTRARAHGHTGTHTRTRHTTHAHARTHAIDPLFVS